MKSETHIMDKKATIKPNELLMKISKLCEEYGYGITSGQNKRSFKSNEEEKMELTISYSLNDYIPFRYFVFKED